MKKTIRSIMFCLAAFAALPVFAQNEIKIEEIDATNLGDGRILFRDAESEAPLNGNHRLIDGYRSEYIVADFTDGFFNGSYEHYRNNALVEKGTYSAGLRNGVFTEYTLDGETVVSESPITDGKVDGVVKKFFSDGSLASEKGYKNGKEHGVERSFRHGEEKPYIDRNYSDGVPDGRQYAEMSSNTGDYVEVCYYDKGAPTGEFLQTWTNGDVKVKGGYKDGKEEGVWTRIRRDGKIESETTYAGGKRNGPAKTFFTDNTVETITMYVDDKRNGVEKKFRFGSIPYTEFTFVNDEWEGEYKRYDDEGNIREEGICRQNYEVYYKEYYDNGQLRRIRERARGGDGWTTLEAYDRDGKREEL